MKLDKDFKQKWIDALRSGKYKQGQGSLYNKHSDSYCCLGVAAEICGVGKINMENVSFIRNTQESNTGILDLEDADLVPQSLTDEMEAKLADLNDGSDWTFEQIADYIEQNY